MESDDDFELFSPAEELSSPTSERKLKRLKRVIRVSDNPLVNLPNGSPSTPAVNFSDSEAQRFEESNEPLRSTSGSESDREDKSSSGFEGSGAKRELEFDSMAEEFEQKGEGGSGEMGEENSDLRMEDSDKKRRNSDGFEVEQEEKKKRINSANDNEKPKSSATNKRREAKERRAYLKQLHVESQRILRESRDAAFKPTLLVQKPISSVLEKIRQRKLEMSKKSIIINDTSFIDDDEDDGSLREVIVEQYSENAHIDERRVDGISKAASEEMIGDPVDRESSLDALRTDDSNDNANHSSDENNPSQMALDEGFKQAFRAPIDDTQDLFSDSQTSDTRDDSPNKLPSSPLEEVLAPSLLAMNLKLDSAPADDISSDEEDNDKENIDPHPHGIGDLSSPQEGDPVKAFVDEEAVEENDSDNDLFRFQDEDEDIDDAEELNVMIAADYKEKPIDSEKRNQLHQMWLEQQDAAGTENLLQRLKCGSKQIETSFSEEEDDEEDEDEEESDGEAAEGLAQTNVRMNLRKMKQMIPQMFNDKDDVFLSSDDEETEKRLAKRCLLEKTEQVTFMSPLEDESSREVFGLIKKLNIVPDTKKRTKPSSFFDTLLTRGNRNISSKSSFIGQRSNSSLPSFQKRGSSTVRSFIFGRDDSNSRSAISMPDDSSDTIQKESRPTRSFKAKFSSSQSKSSTQNATRAEMNSGTSLFEILRHPSLQSSHYTEDNMVGISGSIYAAFKLENKSGKTS